MKRALWITLVAAALVVIAAVGWVVRLYEKATTHEASRRRRERLVHEYELREQRRYDDAPAWGLVPAAPGR